jgi:very-short-patch-repair endonuclease
MMFYDQYDDTEKRKILNKLYIEEKKSFQDIAKIYNTYSNKIRRDAKKLHIKIRNKSDAQKNAINTGKHKHPTKGKQRTQEIKNKIGLSLISSWDSLSEQEKNNRKQKAKDLWDNLSEDEKNQRLKMANNAVREASKVGSKLEHYILNHLIKNGYKVDFHKEQILSNTKLQLDLFVPSLNIAIEVDGPSHFLPVWGEDSLKKNIKYDNKKSGLIIGKGLKLIRIKQKHDFSNARASVVVNNIIAILSNTKLFNNSSIIEIED